MLAKLDALAKPYSPVPGVEMRLLPYRPVYLAAQQERLQQHVQDCGEAWTGFHNIFMLTCPVMTSLNVSGDVPLWCQALKLWYEARTGDIIQDWETFQQVAPNELLTVLWEGYLATRTETGVPEAASELQQPAPVPVTEEGDLNPTMPPGGGKSRKR